MKPFLVIATIFIVSCNNFSEEVKIKSIIYNEPFNQFKSIKEVDLLKEDLFDLPISYLLSDSLTKKYNLKKDEEYKIVRHIFQTKVGSYRRFYLISATSGKVIESSNDPNDFYFSFGELLLEESFDTSVFSGYSVWQNMRY